MKKYIKEILLTVAVCLALIIAMFPTGATKSDDVSALAEVLLTESTQPETTQTVTLYEVPLDEDLQTYIIQLCEEKHIHPAIVFSMCFYESTYNSNAIGDNGNSFGLMQIQPRWHYDRMTRLNCTDLLDPFQNVTVGIDYLAEMRDRYDGHIARALTAYNQGHYNGTVTDYALNVMNLADELRGEDNAIY